MAKADFIDVFTNATQEDLDAILGKIAEHQKQAAGLKAIAHALDVRLNGKKKKAPRAAKGDANGSASNGPSLGVQEKRRKVAAYLKTNGTKSTTKISEVTGISRYGPAALGSILECDWFRVSPDGLVTITERGERAIA